MAQAATILQNYLKTHYIALMKLSVANGVDDVSVFKSATKELKTQLDDLGIRQDEKAKYISEMISQIAITITQNGMNVAKELAISEMKIAKELAVLDADIALKSKQGQLVDEQIAASKADTTRKNNLATSEIAANTSQIAVHTEQIAASKADTTRKNNLATSEIDANTSQIAVHTEQIAASKADTTRKNNLANADIALKGKQGALVDAQKANELQRHNNLVQEAALKANQSLHEIEKKNLTIRQKTSFDDKKKIEKGKAAATVAMGVDDSSAFGWASGIINSI